MRPAGRPRVALGAAVAVAAAAFLWMHAARKKLDQELIASIGRRNSLIDEARRWDERRRRSAQQAGALESVLAASPAARTAEKPSDQAVRPSPLQTLMSDPKLQAKYFAARRSGVKFTYGPLFRSLGLSPEQGERLADLMIHRDETSFDIGATVPGAIQRTTIGSANPFNRQPFTFSTTSEGGHPLSPDSPEKEAAAQLVEQSNAAFQAAATDILGPSGYRQLQDYERALPLRDVVDSLGASQAETGSPLTVDQADRLAQIMADASPSYQRGATANTGYVNWSQVLSQASPLLSQTQMAALQAEAAQEQTPVQFKRALNQAGAFGIVGKLGGGN